MLLFILFCFAICGTNCDNLHKHFQSSLDSDGILQDYLLNDGVEVDPAFKPITDKSEQFQSSPGCPSPTDGYPWVLYGSPPKCYLSGHQGPCPDSTKITYHSPSRTGTCECDCTPNDPTQRENKAFCDQWISGERKSYVKFNEAQKCYQLCSRGPCRWDEVFTLDPAQKMGICVKSQLLQNGNEHNFLIYYDVKERSCISRSRNNVHGFGSEGLRPPATPDDCEEGEIFSKIRSKCVQPFTKAKDE